MATLRIGIDARPLIFPFSGIGRYTQAILSRIIESDNEFYLYSHAPLSAEYSALRTRHALSRSVNALGSLVSQTYFPLWAKQDQLDVFWSPRHHLPLTMNIPGVVTVHDMVWRVAPDTMAPLGRLLERVLMPAALNKAKAIIAVSNSTQDDLLTYDPKLHTKISVIRSAGQINTSSTEPRAAIDVEPPFILFVGTAEPRKNLGRLIPAFLRAKRRSHMDHRLVMVSGAGWNFDLAGCLKENNATAEEIIHFTTQSDAQLAALYATCDFLVLPSLYEGFGLPLAEAMNFGKPCVTSDAGAMAEVVGEAGLRINPLSITSIASAIERLACDPAARSRLGKIAKQRSLLFSWDLAARETLAVLEKCRTE